MTKAIYLEPILGPLVNRLKMGERAWKIPEQQKKGRVILETGKFSSKMMSWFKSPA
jgi:hypothetical protein